MSQRVADVLNELLDAPRGEREARLAELLRDDSRLHGEVCSLLAAYEASETFLEPPRPLDDSPPQSIGRYRIERELGRGAFGKVYLAEDPDLGRSVAIKTLNLAESPAVASRIRSEARWLAAISQPNVAAVYTIEQTATQTDGRLPREVGTWFLTMEYVPGITLLDAMRARPPIEQALDRGRQIAAGLEAAHARGIVHGDLSPRNVRVTPDGWIKILDFGLAVLAAPSSEAGDPAVASGQADPVIRGTPGYMSPEQASGGASTERSDLWSLGSILFESLSGCAAVPGNTVAEILDHTRRGIVNASALDEAVPERVRALVLDSLALDASRRPASARVVRQALEEELLHARAASIFASSERSAPERHPGNLPAVWSSFIGRRAEIAALTALVRDHRLVTVTGPGGVGKTRTAVEAARGLEAGMRDGAWFVDLSDLVEPAEVPATAARALALHDVRAQAPPGEIAHEIGRALARRELLVVFDNCEHVLDAAASLGARLLADCPSVRLLATSRAPLGTPGEQVFDLLPMEVPQAAEDGNAARARDSLRLFESRAALRDPSFMLEGQDLELVRDLCARLDGLPLAIELAASHVRRAPIAAVHARLLESGALPTGGRTAAAARHRSLSDLVAWSHRLLEPTEQTLFARLSVFRGGWTLEAAENVCAIRGLEPWQVCDAMSRLVDGSLVRMEAASAPVRYRFLETVRGYAAARLAEAEEDERLSMDAGYVTYMASLTSRREGEVRASSGWLDRTESEYTNLCHAVDRSVALGRFDLAYRLGGALAAYWTHRGYWAEGLDRLERIRAAHPRAEEAARSASDAALADVAPDLAEVALLGAHAAVLAGGLGRWHLSSARQAEALEVARALQDPAALADVLCAAGLAAIRRHDRDEAELLFKESLDLFRALGKELHAATCLANLGHIYVTRHEPEKADAAYRGFLEVAEAAGDDLLTAKALTGLARSAVLKGDPHDAIAKLERSLALDRDRKSPFGTAVALSALSRAYADIGRYDEARALLLESLEVRRSLGHASAVYAVFASLARLLEAEGRLPAALLVLLAVGAAYEVGRVPANARDRGRVDEGIERLSRLLPPETLNEARDRASRLDEAGLLALVMAPREPGARDGTPP